MATGTDFWVRLAGYPLWLASPHAYTVGLFRDYRLDPSPADRALFGALCRAAGREEGPLRPGPADGAPAPADLALGDLALARLPDGRYLLHRVVGKDDAFYYTRGDNCCSQEAIPRQQVVGVAVEIARRGRRISMAGKIYRLYTWLWMAGYPLRRFTRRIRLGRWMRGKRP